MFLRGWKYVHTRLHIGIPNVFLYNWQTEYRQYIFQAVGGWDLDIVKQLDLAQCWKEMTCHAMIRHGGNAKVY